MYNKFVKITFTEYLKGKDKSFWNPFNFPRWTYFLIPVAISAKEGLFWIIVGEIFFLVTLYIIYLFERRKKVPPQTTNKIPESVEKLRAKKVKHLPFLLILFLVLGGTLLVIFGDQNNIKIVHTQNGLSCVKKILELRGTERHDLLRIHSQEVQKVSDYALLNKHTTEQTIDYFASKGWTKEATTDAIAWSLFKAYATLATSKGATEEEIFNLIKEEKPAWNKDCMQVLTEEIVVDHE